MNLNSVMIGSENPKVLGEYYTKIFGKPTWDEGGMTGWQIGSGGLMLASHDEVKGKNTTPGRILLNIETPDVKQRFDEFKAAGATVVQEPYQPEGAPSDMLVCTFADPDNNYFQLVSPM